VAAIPSAAPIGRPRLAAAAGARRLPGAGAVRTRHAAEDPLAVAIPALDGDVGVPDRARGADATLALARHAVAVDPALALAPLAGDASGRALAAGDGVLQARRQGAEVVGRPLRGPDRRELQDLFVGGFEIRAPGERALKAHEERGVPQGELGRAPR